MSISTSPRSTRAFLAERRVGAKDLVVLNGLPRHVGQADAVAAIVDVRAVAELACSPYVDQARICANAVVTPPSAPTMTTTPFLRQTGNLPRPDRSASGLLPPPRRGRADRGRCGPDSPQRTCVPPCVGRAVRCPPNRLWPRRAGSPLPAESAVASQGGQSAARRIGSASEDRSHVVQASCLHPESAGRMPHHKPSLFGGQQTARLCSKRPLTRSMGFARRLAGGRQC